MGGRTGKGRTVQGHAVTAKGKALSAKGQESNALPLALSSSPSAEDFWALKDVSFQVRRRRSPGHHRPVRALHSLLPAPCSLHRCHLRLTLSTTCAILWLCAGMSEELVTDQRWLIESGFLEDRGQR